MPILQTHQLLTIIEDDGARSEVVFYLQGQRIPTGITGIDPEVAAQQFAKVLQKAKDWLTDGPTNGAVGA